MTFEFGRTLESPVASEKDRRGSKSLEQETVTEDIEYPYEDNSQEIQGALSHIATLGSNEPKAGENFVSREEGKRVESLLGDIDKKLSVVERRLQRRRALFGERFVTGSRLEKKEEELVAERRALVESTWSRFIESINLPAKNFFKATQYSGPTEEFTGRLLANIETIKKLEKRMPGASARLAKDYGIFCFNRYPVHMLCRQLEQEGNTEFPYGAVLYSREDWNGAFDGMASEEELSILDVATKKVGLGVRIFECDGLIDTAKHLIRLDQKYGEQQKIQFAIVSGHGSPNSLELGSRKLETPGGFVTKLSNTFFGIDEDNREDVFPEKALQKMSHFFAENPTIILNSCLTAKGEKGIAHLLASITGSDVIASKKSIGEFVVRAIQKIGEQYKFDVAFAEKGLLGGYSINNARVISKREK